MSDRVARSYHGSEGTSELASHPYESVWMAHWMCRSCKSETKACGHVSIRYEEAQQHNRGVKKHSLFRGFGDVTELKRVRKIDGGLSLAESSKKTRKAISEGQSFPMFSVPPKASVAKPNQKNSTFHGGVLTECSPPALPAWTHTDAWALGATSPPPEQQVKYHNFLDNNSLAVSKSFQDESTRSDSKIVPHQLKGGRTFSSFLCSEKEINLSNSLFASPQHVTNSYNHTLAHEKNFDNNFVSRRSGGSLSRQNDMVFLQHNPSTSSKQQPNFFGRNFLEMQNQSGIGLLSSHTSPQEVTKLEKVFHRSLPSLQCSVHNTETMRICATVNAEEESSRGPPVFSKTTHHFQITKKTGVNLPERGQVFGQSTASTKLKGKAFGDHFGFSTDCGLPAQPRLKLLPYRSPTESNGEEDVRDVEAYALESSSETDILDMDAFQDNPLPGVASSASDKHVQSTKKSPKSRSAFTSGGEENGARLLYTKLPDINQELPDSAEERETSTSRTQSLGAEHLLSHAEQPTNSNCNACQEGSQGLETRSSWIKRLKLSATQPAYGAKSSNSGFLGKEQMVPDQAAMLLRDWESSPIDSARKGRNITLSHPWIQRWSKVPSQKKSEKVVFQSECSKPTVDEFQKKQFPSIAAMALMGKAMSGFHPCFDRDEFRTYNAESHLHLQLLLNCDTRLDTPLHPETDMEKLAAILGYQVLVKKIVLKMTNPQLAASSSSNARRHRICFEGYISSWEDPFLVPQPGHDPVVVEKAMSMFTVERGVTRLNTHLFFSINVEHMLSRVLMGKMFGQPLDARLIKWKLGLLRKNEVNNTFYLDHFGRKWFALEFTDKDDLKFVLKNRPWYVRG